MKYALLVLSILFFTIVNFSYSQDLPCKEQYYNKRCKERYVEDANGRVHGKRISYLEDGQVEKIAYYNHGTLNGTVTEFYNWGKIITTYLNRVENGLYQKLENNGKILEKGNYTNGVQTGYWITNQGNNKGNYVNGVQTGYWIENQYDKGNFVNGEKQGAWELYMEGWEGDGGIIKGNYNNGKFNGTWSNVVVIRINNPYRRGDQIYYMQGYKAVFENGVYIQGFDEKGVDLITVEKRKQADADSIKRDDEEKAIIANPSLLFYSDSYYPIDSDNLRQFLSAFSNNINSHSGNDSVKIGIVGNTKNLSDISEQAAKGFYILSLNRAIAIQKILSPMITNKKVSYKYLGLGIQDSGYDEAKGNVKIFINQDIPDQYSTIYYELKSRFGVGSSENLIVNVELLKLELWNIYMKTYGVETEKIIKKIPPEFINNIHINNALSELPSYMQRYDYGLLSIDNYKKEITEKISKINSEIFNKEIVEPVSEHKKK